MRLPLIAAVLPGPFPVPGFKRSRFPFIPAPSSPAWKPGAAPHLPGKSWGIPVLGEPAGMEQGCRESLEAQQGFREVGKPKGFGELGKDTEMVLELWGKREREKGGDENDPGQKKGKGWEARRRQPRAAAPLGKARRAFGATCLGWINWE